MGIPVLRLIAFLLSNLGYVHFFGKKLNITREFMPAFVVCMHTTILCLAGISGILLPAAIALHGAGFVLLGLSLLRDRKKLLTDNLRPGFLYLLLALGVLFAVLYGQKLTRYDNFSHWGVVARGLLETNRFPNASDKLVMFQDYPLATTSYIYFFSLMVGRSEHIWMLAQSYMTICFITPLFAHVRKYRLPAVAAMLLFTNYLLCCNGSVVDLLVDTLLPLQAMAALFFICHECFEKEQPLPLFWSIPFLCTTIQIKNSGIFFIAAACALILYYTSKHKRPKLPAIIVCAAPFVMLMLWKLHCRISFDAAETSKHAMTLENYAMTLGLKSFRQILSIAYHSVLASVCGKSLYLALGMLALVGLITLALDRQSIRAYLKMAAAAGVLYAVYMLGIILMYIFSMPLAEAKNLASFERYRQTLLIAVYYMMAAHILKLFSRSVLTRRILVSAVSVLAMLAVTHTATFSAESSIFIRYDEVRSWLESVIEKYSLPSDSTYCICIPEGDSGYMLYLSRYLLRSTDIQARVVKSVNMLNKCNPEYLIINDPDNPIIQQWVADNYPAQAGKEVIFMASPSNVPN